ncbi:MAG: lysoplasmalogenase [Chitinophagaceae bacterium]|nr:lysoplasmalogenase [Chitinophagaceae bacterium]
MYLFSAIKSTLNQQTLTLTPKTDPDGNPLSTRPINTSILILAFTASWAGDLFLMFEGQGLFIAGMVSFMIAHVSYCYLFNQIQPFRKKNALYPILLGAFVFHLGTDVMNIILHNLGDLMVPVYLYMFVITTMAVFAFMTMAVKDTEYWGKYFFAPGAAFFVISDMLLAMNIFAFKEYFIGIWVMATYGLAQYLIAKGFYSYILRK